MEGEEKMKENGGKGEDSGDVCASMRDEETFVGIKPSVCCLLVKSSFIL